MPESQPQRLKMRQHLDPHLEATERGSRELSIDAVATDEVSAGEALTHAQSKDREWRAARRKALSRWIRRLSRLGLLADAAARIGVYGGILIGLAALPFALFMPPIARVIVMFAALLLALAPLLYVFAWLVYVALGLLARWGKHEAILDQLPTRRPLLWPGNPHPR